jgi:large conductance mechanosensitive channel
VRGIQDGSTGLIVGCPVYHPREEVIFRRSRRAIDMLNDFKAFLQRGNVVELAVAVVIGGAFGKIVTSLVDDMVMPIVGVILGGVSFKDLALKVGQSTIKYGNFIQSAFDFFVIAMVVFVLVRAYEKLRGEKVKTS